MNWREIPPQYRSLLGHDGSAKTLEEWLDPARLRNDCLPSGFKGYKVAHRAVPGTNMV